MSSIRRISDRASVNVAGEPADPCHVIAGPSLREGAKQDIKVAIDTRVVLHELNQCGINVSQDTLRDFVANDSRSEQGRNAYITFARFVMRPLSPVSGVHHTITPRWVWIETTGV